MTPSPSPTTTSSRTAPASPATPRHGTSSSSPASSSPSSNKHVLIINPPFRGRPAISALDELAAGPERFEPGHRPPSFLSGVQVPVVEAHRKHRPVRRRRVLVLLQPPDQPERTRGRRRPSVGKAAGRFLGLPQHLAGRVHLFARGGGKEHPFDHRRRQGGQGRAGDDSPVDAADVPDRRQFRAGRPAGDPPAE